MSIFDSVIRQLINQHVVVSLVDNTVYTGTLFAGDDRHIVIQDQDGMSLINVECILNLDWSPYIEIVAPG